MEKDINHQKELPLLPPPPPPQPQPPSTPSSSHNHPWLNHHQHRRLAKPPLYPFDNRHGGRDCGPSLDLQLSINLEAANSNFDCIESLKWQSAEQIRLAAIEKACAERVRELTRREIALAQTEFARARAIWEKAREEVVKAEKLRDNATVTACMGEVTCHSCFQREEIERVKERERDISK